MRRVRADTLVPRSPSSDAVAIKSLRDDLNVSFAMPLDGPVLMIASQYVVDMVVGGTSTWLSFTDEGARV